MSAPIVYAIGRRSRLRSTPADAAPSRAGRGRQPSDGSRSRPVADSARALRRHASRTLGSRAFALGSGFALGSLGGTTVGSSSTRGAWTLAMISSPSVSSVTSAGTTRSRTWIVVSKSMSASIEYSIDCGR